jgi:hypothetical protein
VKKYLLISHKYDFLKRGAFITSNRFVESYSEHLDYKLDLDAQNLEELNEQYKRLIFTTQVISNYRLKLNLTRLRNLNYIFFLRNTQNPLIYNSASNGFHYYKTYKNIKFYIPSITDFSPIENKVYNKNLCLGFYIRRNITPDSVSFINDFLKNLKIPVDVYVMGNPAPEFLNYKCVNTYNHTYNQIEFFENITHYMYPASKQFQDPFPNSVLEAVQSGVQIIFPEIYGRNHKDGIDDIKDCIYWHKNFNPDIKYDNTDCILTDSKFKKFFLNLFDNNFEYSFDRNKYKYFSDWIEGEIV